MAMPSLSYHALRMALVQRLVSGDDIAKGRAAYVGASEVGSCPRIVSYRKGIGLPWDPEPDSAGVMLPGKLAEKEGIEFLRILGFDPEALSATGDAQAQFTEGNLRAHPDGLLAAGSFTLDPGSAYFREDGTIWKYDEILALLVGPGILEFKSGSASVFRDAIHKGIPLPYRDQVQSGMGLSNRSWALMFFVCRDNLSKMALFFVPFQESQFLELQRHADAIMGSAALVQNEILGLNLDDEESDDIINLVSPLLLDPDPNRGYCQYCPLRHECPALVRVRESGEFPADVLDEIEALALMAIDAGEARKASEKEEAALKDKIKEMSQKYGASSAPLSSNAYEAMTISKMIGRESCNLERLKSDFPDAHVACVKRGEDFQQIRFSKRKKAKV